MADHSSGGDSLELHPSSRKRESRNIIDKEIARKGAINATRDNEGLNPQKAISSLESSHSNYAFLSDPSSLLMPSIPILSFDRDLIARNDLPSIPSVNPSFGGFPELKVSLEDSKGYSYAQRNSLVLDPKSKESSMDELGHIPRFAFPSVSDIEDSIDGGDYATDFYHSMNESDFTAEENSQFIPKAGDDDSGPEALDELLGFTNSRRKKRRKVRMKKRRKGEIKKKISGRGRLQYTAGLTKKLGEANGYYLSKDFPNAISLLLQVIKEEPRVPTAYETLSSVYEEQGDLKKSLEVMIVAAHLNKRDPYKWITVAERAVELEDYQSAAYCFTRLMGYESHAKWATLQRAWVLQKQGNYTKSISDLKNLNKKFKGDVEILGYLVDALHHLGNKEEAMLTLRKHFAYIITCLEGFQQEDDEDVSFESKVIEVWDIGFSLEYCKLLMEFEQYESIQEFARKMFKLLPRKKVPFEIHVYYGIACLYLDENSQAEVIFSQLYDLDVSLYYDMFLEVGKAYLSLQMEDSAIVPLEMLISNSLGIGDYLVFHMLAKCYFSLEDFDRALEMAEKALELNNLDIEVRFLLSSIYSSLGETTKAIEAMGKNLKDHLKFPDDRNSKVVGDAPHIVQTSRNSIVKPMKTPSRSQNLSQTKRRKRSLIPTFEHVEMTEQQMNVLSHTAELLVKKSQFEEIIDLLFDPLHSHLSAVVDHYLPSHPRSNSIILTSIQSSKKGSIRVSHAQSMFKNGQFVQLLLLLLKSLASCGQSESAVQIIELCEYFDRYISKDSYSLENVGEQLKELHLLAICILQDVSQYDAALDRLRPFLMAEPDNNNYINLAAGIFHYCRYLPRYRRFLDRIAKKNASPGILAMCGHGHLAKRAFPTALKYYLEALRMRPEDPLLNLICGITTLCKGATRYAERRHQIILRGIAFFKQYEKYRLLQVESSTNSLKKRKEIQSLEIEIWYNQAVGYQLLGLFNLAIPLYEKVLKRNGHHLIHSAAHNLSRIYRSKGNDALAREIILTHNRF